MVTQKILSDGEKIERARELMDMGKPFQASCMLAFVLNPPDQEAFSKLLKTVTIVCDQAFYLDALDAYGKNDPSSALGTLKRITNKDLFDNYEEICEEVSDTYNEIRRAQMRGNFQRRKREKEAKWLGL